MFGGAGLYRDGVMFGLVVSDGEIFLKCDADVEPRFRAAGCHPFIYSRDGKSTTMSYWSLPMEALDDGDAIKVWADLAYQVALRSPKAKSRKAKKKR